MIPFNHGNPFQQIPFQPTQYQSTQAQSTHSQLTPYQYNYPHMSQNPITNKNSFINHNLTPQATSQKDCG